jgi:hypothetical protein
VKSAQRGTRSLTISEIKSHEREDGMGALALVERAQQILLFFVRLSLHHLIELSPSSNDSDEVILSPVHHRAALIHIEKRKKITNNNDTTSCSKCFDDGY